MAKNNISTRVIANIAIIVLISLSILSLTLVSAGPDKIRSNFTYSPANPATGDIVQFTDISTPGKGATAIISWEWDFNNDNSIDSTEQNPAHTFTKSGKFPVSLIVKDDAGNTAEQVYSISVVQGYEVSSTGQFAFIPLAVGGFAILAWSCKEKPKEK